MVILVGKRGGEGTNIESASRGSSMRMVKSGRTYTACAETSKKRSAVVRVCGSHCFCDVDTERIDRMNYGIESYTLKMKKKTIYCFICS